MIWDGFDVFCLASGPSLCAEDVQRVAEWRAQDENRRVIVVNTTFRAAPWADVLYAMDAKWWLFFAAEVEKTFPGMCVTIRAHRHLPRIRYARTKTGNEMYGYGNSGAGAIALAHLNGAANVYLLGYDCQAEGSKIHWHGDHPVGMGNAGSIGKWPQQFQALANAIKMPIFNCSRKTALKVFPKTSLESILEVQHEVKATAG